MNQKLEAVLEYSDQFIPRMNEEVSKLPPAKPLAVTEDAEGGQDVSNDMVVCVRVRPMLNHEAETGFLQNVFASNPNVLTLDNSFDVRGKVKVTASKFNVDVAFSPTDDNETVYRTIATPLVEMALKGGTSTILAYGQTGSGKTFTISGMLQLMAEDLVKNMTGVRLHASFFEIQGSVSVDLLNEKVNVEVMEDKFGKVGARVERTLVISYPMM